MVVKRRTVRQPKMRSKTSRVRRRYVQHDMFWRWRAAIGNDNRRVHVPHAEHNPERLKFAHLSRLDQISDLATCGFTNRAWRLKIRPNDLSSGVVEVMDRLDDCSLMYRAPLDFISCKQIITAPAGEMGGHLPPEIDCVTDPHVHTEAAERWMQMTSVAHKKHPAAGIMVSYETVCDPQIGADDLNGEIAQPSPAADEIRSV